MIPPTSIDGTDITGATIDGTDVQKITVDGQTVFTAGPTPADAFARYRFENDVTDSNGSNDGTDQTSAGFSGNAQEGSFAKEFDGSNDYVDIGRFPLSSFTVAFWMRPDSVDDCMISRYDPDENGAFVFDIRTDVRFFVQNNSGLGEVFASTSIQASTYTHVAGVNDANGDLKVYINGNLEGTDVGGGLNPRDPSTRDIDIGRRGKRNGFTDYFDGLIDDLLIFDSALSDSDVQSIYNSY